MQPSQEAFNMNPSKLEAQWDPINVVRFCFAKKDETLQVALERLSKV